MDESESLTELPEPVVLDTDSTNRLAVEIVGDAREAGLKMGLSIGSRLLEAIFHNRLEVWHRHEDGAPSLVNVSETIRGMGHTELSYPQLCKCINLVEQNIVLDGLNKWPNLGATHFEIAQVLPLDQQAAVFDKADAQSLSTRDFQDVVDKLMHRQPKEPKPSKTLADAIFRAAEKLRRDLGTHDKLFSDLQEAGMGDAFVKAFHQSFDRFTGDVEDLELMLPQLGATLPDDLIEQFEKNRAKRMEPYQKPPPPSGSKAPEDPDKV